MIRFSYALALFSTLFFLGGCKNPSIYYWGNYEEQIYGMYAAPDQVTAEAQIDVLLADQEKARSKNKPLPPGFHAHLGFLYFQLGRYVEARHAFELEKANFPESGQLMDRFISKI